MGRPLGSYGSEELDRPDLNKCPDCGCFFATDCCPLCNKLCPEEMRAGNRKPVKHPKRRQNGSGRVTFIEWYHSWWFIILMLFAAPIIGIVLLITSPHKKSVKLAVVAVGLAWTLLSTFGFGIFMHLQSLWNKPVDTSLSREEYIAACEEMTPEAFYRSADSLQGKFVSVTLTVGKRFTDGEAYPYDDYSTYYLCYDEAGNAFTIMIRDCVQDEPQNLIAGDRITVYGEGAGTCSVYDEEYNLHAAPCINVAYVTTQ